jgi:hypothetical protein
MNADVVDITAWRNRIKVRKLLLDYEANDLIPMILGNHGQEEEER